MALRQRVSLWRTANARNVRLYHPYWQYTDHSIFRFVSLLCLRSTLRLLQMYLMVSNSLDVAQWSRSIGCKKTFFEEKYLAKFHRFSSYCYNSQLRASCSAEFTQNFFGITFTYSFYKFRYKKDISASELIKAFEGWTYSRLTKFHKSTRFLTQGKYICCVTIIL